MTNFASRPSGVGRLLVTALLSIGIVPWTVSTLLAQPDFATFQGTVTDETGNPLVGATVVVRLVSRNTGEELVTNEKGEFRHRGFRPGEYEVTVEKEAYQGFRETLRLAARAMVKREYQLTSLITPAHAAFNRGVEAFNAGNLEEAALEFEESVKLAPDVLDGHANLAAIYSRLGREEEALAELQKMVELSPGSFQAQSQLAATYAQMNRFDDAIATYEAAFAKVEDVPPGPAAYDAWMNLGTLYFMSDRARDAIGAFEEALAANPSSAKALLAIGKARFNLGETDEAIAAFRKVIAAAPESSEAAEAKGYIEQFEKPPGGAV